MVNMDNMLPLIIYTMIYAQTTNLTAEMALLDNYITYQVESGSDC